MITYLQLNNSEAHKYQNVWSATKVIFRGKFIYIITYVHSFENKKDGKINHAFKSKSYKRSNKTQENRRN